MLDHSSLNVILLTPPGRGAVATLRVEGPGAVAAVQTYFRTRDGRPLAEFSSDRLAIGRFGDGGEEVVVRRCADDAVELHCHGGFAAAAAIEESLAAAGCQPLEWREWATVEAASCRFAPAYETADANNAAGCRVYRWTAAALAALADARTERTAAILLDQYHGALGRALGDIRQAIDRGEDEAARRQIDALRARIDLGRHLLQPWRVVLAGPVNAGKSSLINALTGFDRAIVHPTPGTTRDVVTAITAIDGWPVELCDTAGLRNSDDAVECAGIERAEERLGMANLIVLVFDGSTSWTAEEQMLLDRWPGALLVHNKCDLLLGPGNRPAGLSTSAVRGDGVQELLDRIAGRLIPDPPLPGAAVPFTAEQIAAVNGLAV